MEEVDLDGEKDGSNLKSRTPFLLQDVEADSAKLVYVWVVDPCDEPDLRIIAMIFVVIILNTHDDDDDDDNCYKIYSTFGAVIG